MSEVKEQDSQFNMNRVSVNVSCMKVYVIQSKNRIVRKVGESVKNEVIVVLVKMIIC